MKRTLLPRARAPRAAFALLAVATWAAAQTSVRAAFEEAVARGDRAGALRSGVEELRRRCAAPPSGEAEVDAAAFLMRVAPFAVDAPGEWLAALETCRGEGRFGALIAARRADALARIGRRDEAVAAWRALGVVGRWLVAGPFDNERGAGFKATAPPETSPVDPEAVFDGKDRKVGWRSVSADLPYGVWHLGDLVTPREQALVVLAAALQTEAPRAVALALGSSGPVAVRLNGREVFRSDAARELAYEQDLVRLDLAAGTNELLVKTGVEQGPFSVYVRLAAVDGGPPPADVRISSAPDAFRRTPFPPAPESAASRPAPDDFLARAAAAASAADASPAALERWIRLRLGLTLDDAAKPATADVAERLLKLRPDDLAARELRATSLRRRVRVAAERADNARLEALEATLALDPKHVPTLVEIARTAMDELNQPELARAKLAVAAAAAPRAAAVLRLQARLAQYDGQTGEAERLLKAAAEAGGPFDRLALGDFYAERGRFRDAEATFAAAHGVAAGERDVIDRRLRRAQMRGDLDGAMASARELVALVPTEARLRLRLAAAHEARGDFEGALREAEAQLAYDPENVDALKRAALNADRLDRREDALRFVARALVVAPGDLKLRRYEGRLAGAEKAFEDAFPLDVDAIVRAAPDVSVNPENRSHRVLLSRRITLVHPEGTTADFHQQVVQILSEAGVAAFDTVAAWHDPGDQRARFRTARLHRPGEAPQEAQRQGTWGADFPPLRPGDVVEWSYRVDDLRTGVFGNYVGVRHPFQDRSLAETVRSELTLLLPKSRGFRFHVRHADLTPEPVAVPGFLDGYEGRRYVVNDLPAITWEPAMPYPEEFVPEVQVSTYESWDAFAAWWWNLIRDQIDVNDAMRAKVRELTAGLTDDEAKLRRLYGFVVTDVRYVAWEFGVHGYKPYRTSAIFERRFGDCKDKALLLCALLGEVGVKAYPVVIRAEDARPKEDHALAMVEHFNHCIAAIPGPDGAWRFFDGTAEFHGADDLPDGDRGAQVVIVQDGRAVPATIPHAPPERNREREVFDVALRADGGATIRATVDCVGRDAAAARAQFVNEADRAENLGRTLNARFGQGTVSASEFSRLDDLEAPVRYGWTFEAKDALSRDGTRARLKPLWPEFDWTSLASGESRRFDIVLGEPGATEIEAVVSLPPALRVAHLPGDVVLEAPFATYRLERVAADGRIVFKRSLIVKAPRVKAADYAAFRTFVAQAAAADADAVVLEEVR